LVGALELKPLAAKLVKGGGVEPAVIAAPLDTGVAIPEKACLSLRQPNTFAKAMPSKKSYAILR